MSQGRIQTPVSGSGVAAGGMASATAALVTSKFGFAGTIAGAAIITMIITGGSAYLKMHFERASEKVRQVPGGIQSRVNQRGYPPPAQGNKGLEVKRSVDRPTETRGWFAYTPRSGRRGVVGRGAIATLLAFIISLVVVTAIEAGIGNSLSCRIWSNCPRGAAPGIHLASSSGAGSGTSISLLRSKFAGGTLVSGQATPSSTYTTTSSSSEHSSPNSPDSSQPGGLRHNPASRRSPPSGTDRHSSGPSSGSSGMPGSDQKSTTPAGVGQPSPSGHSAGGAYQPQSYFGRMSNQQGGQRK